MDRDTAASVRSQVLRGAIQSVGDGGEAQTVTVQTHDGVVRADVEVMQLFGFASVPPAGAVTVLLAAGGDPGDALALPASHPGHRFGGLAAGEAVLYDAAGNRVLLRDGVIIEIVAATQVLVKAPSMRLEGDFHVTGNVTVEGDVTAGTVSLRGHRHTGVVPGAGVSGTPQA